jgi:hypothetical protein
MRGADKLQETMTFGWFDVATVIHEFCHALGMIHEHQNPLENPIQWNVEAIVCAFRASQGWDVEKIKQNIINAYQLDQTNGSKYDEDSIMIYSFQKDLPCTYCQPLNNDDSSRCTERMLPATLNGIEVKPKYKMSPTDMKWLQIMYPKDGKRDMTQIRTMLTDVEDIPNLPDGGGGEGGGIRRPVWMDSAAAQKTGEFFKKNGKKIAFGVATLIGVWIIIKLLTARSAAAVPSSGYDYYDS